MPGDWPAEYRQRIDRSPYGVILTNSENEIVHVSRNQPFVRAGYNPEEAKGRRVQDLFKGMFSQFPGLTDKLRALKEGRAFSVRLPGYDSPFLKRKANLWVFGVPSQHGNLFITFDEGELFSKPRKRGFGGKMLSAFQRLGSAVTGGKSKNLAFTLLVAVNSVFDAYQPEAEGHALSLVELSQILRGKKASFHERVMLLGHDPGKIGVSYETLSKPAQLNDEEWREMRRHMYLSAEMLDGVLGSVSQRALKAIKTLHLRFDGKDNGYPNPDGLKGKRIPYLARWGKILDAYSAMREARPYAPSLTHEEAVKELKEHAGTQFDPALVRKFVKLAEKAKAKPAIDYLYGV